ncbi:MAG: helix-turn-helix domain-containing protein [Bacillus sp. (in: firmicutes)]
MEATSDNATVTVHIGKIRDKIERYSPDDSYIETVWGVGYRFRA